MPTTTVFAGQPKDNEGPIFKEPWEAQAFAMMVALHEQGLFSWDEWATALSEEIKLAQHSGDPDLGDSYYQHWLAALEKLVNRKQLSSPAELRARIEKWRRAYKQTPHGQPILLANAER